MPRAIVAILGENSERRQPLGWAELDFDLSPFTVSGVVAWVVSQNILIAELHTYFSRNVGQIIQILYSECSTAGHLRHLVQQRWTVAFFGGSATVLSFIDADGVELHICFTKEISDVSFIVAAVVIAPIRYDEQSAFGVARALHLTQA